MAAPIYKSAKKADEKKPVEKAADEKPEPRNAKGQTQGEERDDVSDKSPIGEGADAEGGDADMEAKERAEMFKRHMSEHTDHHNNARETLKQMHKRHEKEIAAMNKAQSERMMPTDAGEAAVAAGEAAPAAAAEE
jgi:hypothetical protein